MKRSLTVKNLYDKRTGPIVKLHNPVLERAIGPAEKRGIWLGYGPEKNGKTAFMLTLAKDLAAGEKIAYISAEEGTDKSFIDACQRVGITRDTRMTIDEFMPVPDIIEKFSRPRQPDIIFIDNLLVYKDELSGLGLRKLSEALPNKLLVCVGHEERKEPYPAAAVMAKKLAKVYFHIVGMKVIIAGRFAPQGGEITISDDLGEMYWGAAD